jgi:hypothetical protein
MKTRGTTRLNTAPAPAKRIVITLRLMPGPDDMPHYKAFPVNQPKPILGCHPRLLSKLLSK